MTWHSKFLHEHQRTVLPFAKREFKGVGQTAPLVRRDVHAIHHQLCIDCGVDVFARGKKPDGSDVVALNVSCIDGIDHANCLPPITTGTVAVESSPR